MPKYPENRKIRGNSTFTNKFLGMGSSSKNSSGTSSFLTKRTPPLKHIFKGLNHPSTIATVSNYEDNIDLSHRRTSSKWSAAEDAKLVELVEQYGSKSWTVIASKLGNRAGKQCRERWKNHLDPAINHEPFTKQEDESVIRMVNEMGTKWAQISKLMPGRTENAIKNRYYSSLLKVAQKRKKQLAQQQAKARAKRRKLEKSRREERALEQLAQAAAAAESPDMISYTPEFEPSAPPVRAVSPMKDILPERTPSVTLHPQQSMHSQYHHIAGPERFSVDMPPAGPTAHSALMMNFLPSNPHHFETASLTPIQRGWHKYLTEDFSGALDTLKRQWAEVIQQETGLDDQQQQQQQQQSMPSPSTPTPTSATIYPPQAQALKPPTPIPSSTATSTQNPTPPSQFSVPRPRDLESPISTDHRNHRPNALILSPTTARAQRKKAGMMQEMERRRASGEWFDFLNHGKIDHGKIDAH
jgi:hypothetical protein